MVHLDKIYTKGGDKGTTSLVGGERVAKSSFRLEAYGTIDELNSVIGVLRTCCAESGIKELEVQAATVLHVIQNDLFDIGSLLATAPGSKWEGMRELKPGQVSALEESMDGYQTILEPLPSFTLPGGGMANAHAHVCRTVCRRAERVLWRLHEDEPVAELILQYINRLSDHLFVYSRWVAVKTGAPEYLWDTEVSRGGS